VPIPLTVWTSRPFALVVAAALVLPALASCGGGAEEACAQASNLRVRIAHLEDLEDYIQPPPDGADGADVTRKGQEKIEAQLATFRDRLIELDEACSGS
jgi:hypothetical protein